MYKNIYAPWRFKYVTSHSSTKGCILCQARDSGKDKDSYILHRGKFCFIILNLFPYNNGHIMVVPNSHVKHLNHLKKEQLIELITLATQCESVLEKVYQPQGFNLGMNIGKCSGAGIDDHIHLHIIPRWDADTSFITAIGQTRIIPEDIKTTFKKLQSLF
jgi:ATP adenylyltransferase